MADSLLEGAPQQRAAAIMAIAAKRHATASDLEALVSCLGDASKLVQRRAAETCALLAGQGGDAESRLRDSLAAESPRTRWGAAYALSLADRLPIDSLPTLLEVLGSDDGDLRWAAADLIKRLAAADRDRVAKALIAAAQARNPASRKMALYCLRDLDIQAATDVAAAALADEWIEVRLAALAFLAAVHRDPSSAAQRIAALVDDADPRMQRAAAGTLGRLGVDSMPVAEALRLAARSADPSLRRAAAGALRQLKLSL